MQFHTALFQRTEIETKRNALDESYDKKLAELRTVYEKRKEILEKNYLKADAVLTKAQESLALTDPRVILGSRAVRIVGDWALAGRDGTHCCEQAALSIARTNGASLGHYSYCTVTQGPIHGVYDVLPLGSKPKGNDVPLFRIEGTPEVAHRIHTGVQLPDNVVEAAAYFVQHLPQLFRMGWKWTLALQDDRDLFAGNPELAEALAEVLS